VDSIGPLEQLSKNFVPKKHLSLHKIIRIHSDRTRPKPELSAYRAPEITLNTHSATGPPILVGGVLPIVISTLPIFPIGDETAGLRAFLAPIKCAQFGPLLGGVGCHEAEHLLF
jgi:hypothetical protein